MSAPSPPRVGLITIAREWTRIGVTGFGGPPAHIALLRELVVQQRGWIEPEAFADGIAACGLLPGPASTQLAILCAYRLGGPAGAIVGGLGFILPAVILIIALSAVVLGRSAPLWLRAAGAGAGAAVAAVAVHAALGLARPSWERVRRDRALRLRWTGYLVAGVAAAALVGPFLVLVLFGCGILELAVQRRRLLAAGLAAHVVPGSTLALAWTALKVGALSFGGGFVIIPLMQGDAVHAEHWMSASRFLTAVALGQVTPGPVVATVAAVGYAAAGVGGALLAALIAFAPSFAFVLIGGRRFERVRAQPGPRAFLDGAGPAAIGAIFGAAITLAASLGQAWQACVLAAALGALLLAGRGVVLTLVAAAGCGVVLVAAGLPAS